MQIITFCFCVTDYEALVKSDFMFPIIRLVNEATGSKAGAVVMGSLLLILLYFSTVTTVASSSRQIWAFSRDQGFPFSNWIRQVRPGWDIPLNAVRRAACIDDHLPC